MGNKKIGIILGIALLILITGCNYEQKDKTTSDNQVTGHKSKEIEWVDNKIPQSSEQQPPIESANKGAISEIKWYTSFENGLMMAKKQNKPIMIDFYTTWCHWCKQLDKITYTNQEVIELSKGFISIKVDCEENPQIQSKFGITGFPTIIFINTAGKISNIVRGYREPDLFALEIKKALK